MSDEDDERMDRAKRIRELREGRRVTDADGDASAEATERGDDPAAADEATETATADDPGPDETPASDRETADEDSTEGATAGTETDGDGDRADTASIGDPPTDDAATEAVQAAAQAAQEFEGEGGVAMELQDESTADQETTGSAGESAGSGDAETTRVLEFRLGEELYCLNIAYVEEIVHEETVTRVPNTPEYVSGVVDLRGQITTILDPKIPVGLDSDVPSDEQLIVVFDAEQFEEHGNMGWLVDEVNQVTPIREEEVKDSPIQEAYINGIIERDDEFVIWTRPELALDLDED